MIGGQSVFDQPLKKRFKKFDNIKKIVTGQGGDYTTGCLLDYLCFKNYYKVITIDLSKQQALGADPKAIQQIKFIVNLDQNVTLFSII